MTPYLLSLLKTIRKDVGWGLSQIQKFFNVTFWVHWTYFLCAFTVRQHGDLQPVGARKEFMFLELPLRPHPFWLLNTWLILQLHYPYDLIAFIRVTNLGTKYFKQFYLTAIKERRYFACYLIRNRRDYMCFTFVITNLWALMLLVV